MRIPSHHNSHCRPIVYLMPIRVDKRKPKRFFAALPAPPVHATLGVGASLLPQPAISASDFGDSSVDRGENASASSYDSDDVSLASQDNGVLFSTTQTREVKQHTAHAPLPLGPLISPPAQGGDSGANYAAERRQSGQEQHEELKEELGLHDAAQAAVAPLIRVLVPQP